ncbi:MAG: hypothetical protein LBI04_07995 [Treponema sp.]|jgi:hypothetical protein|nr:hypothetical protein [Treponema sp.]
MKKYIISVFLTLVIFSLVSVSCKSTPKASPEQETAIEELKAANSRVDKARKSAIDFEAPSYFPSEWEDAEAQYADARRLSVQSTLIVSQIAAGTYTDDKIMPDSSIDEFKESAAALDKVADRYEELFDMAIPLYAQAREDEILAVREELISSQFSTLFPKYLENADKIALTAQEQYEAKDYYTARETAVEALAEYETLRLGAKILSARQEIADRGFAEYDPENFEKADEISQAAVVLYDSGDKKGAIESAEEALLRYNIVLTNGWTAYAAERRASAISERENAIANKVNIAVRESFREADTTFNNAEESYKNEMYSVAGIQYVEAEALFVIAGQQTEEKRQLAMETIRQAEEKIEESTETATEAEKIIEGGSK